LLEIGEKGRAVRELVGLFFRQEGKDELYMTALAMEELNDARAVPSLIRALLEDSNPHRRHAAARALALCLADPGQPQAAREEEAESLAYVGNAETVEALIGALTDADVRIRFWVVFGLGGSCRGEARAVRALEGVLGDGETPPGNWWPVGREALAMLGGDCGLRGIRIGSYWLRKRGGCWGMRGRGRRSGGGRGCMGILGEFTAEQGFGLFGSPEDSALLDDVVQLAYEERRRLGGGV
jgi:hypothetical protein